MTETANSTERRAGGMRRGVRILLFVSLALNVAVAGLFIGAVAKHRWEDRAASARHIDDGPGGPLTRALSKDDRRAIGREIRRELRESRPSRDDIRARYAGVIEALRKVPFDPGPLRGGLDAKAQDFDARLRMGHALLVDRVIAMSDDERAAYADRLEEALDRRRGRGGDRGRDEKDD